MKRRSILVIVCILLAAVVSTITFFARAPVLIVTDMVFIALYGESRIRVETLRSSLALFRPVRVVPITDDASADIISQAVSEAAARPFCVIFPLRFATAAQQYREHNPNIPVVILEGQHLENTNPASFAIGSNTSDYFLYRTDITADFYRAGLAAAILSGESSDDEDGSVGRIAVFLEPRIQTEARTAFLQGLNNEEKQARTSFYTTFGQFSNTANLSVVVLGGLGAEYLDRHSGVPVIFFTWINPELLPVEVVMVLNDSPFVKAVEAARMVSAGVPSGQIRSRMEVLSSRRIDRNTLTNLRKIK